MTYHDDIITIKLCRGELAASLGEQGLMIKDWAAFAAALKRELTKETPSRDDGHTGSSDVGDLLIERVVERCVFAEAGLAPKPNEMGHPDECWPSGQKWFDGQ